VAVLRWGQGAQPPPCPAPHPKFLDTVVLLLVELIGSIVIALKYRLAVVASQMMRGQQARIQRGVTAVETPRKVKNVLQNASKCTISKEKMPKFFWPPRPYPPSTPSRLHSSGFGTRPPDHISAYGPGGQAPQIFFPRTAPGGVASRSVRKKIK